METGVTESEDRGPERSAPRDSLFLLTSFTTPQGVTLGQARVRNLSASGLMADCEAGLTKGQPVVMELRGVGRVYGTIAWVRANRVGISFDSPVDPQLARRPIADSGKHRNTPDFLRTPTMQQLRTPRKIG
jgi:hypothetical protein